MKNGGLIDIIMILIPYFFVICGVFSIQLPNKFYYVLLIVFSFLIMMLPIITNVYQIGITSIGMFYAVQRSNLWITASYGLIFVACVAINVFFLIQVKNMSKESQDGKSSY